MGMQSSRILQFEQAILMKCLSTFGLEGRGFNRTTSGTCGGTKKVLLAGMMGSCSGLNFCCENWIKLALHQSLLGMCRA
jgi:hypothetical protein